MTKKFCTCYESYTDMCKISLWSVEHISNQIMPNFGWISIEILLVERAPGHLAE